MPNLGIERTDAEAKDDFLSRFSVQRLTVHNSWTVPACYQTLRRRQNERGHFEDESGTAHHTRFTRMELSFLSAYC